MTDHADLVARLEDYANLFPKDWSLAQFSREAAAALRAQTDELRNRMREIRAKDAEIERLQRELDELKHPF
jgi:predicted RNase H-like nuclease (RuvC/YqgF family)